MNTIGGIPPRLFFVHEFHVPGWGVIQGEAVGSRQTCDPPPTSADQDWLVPVSVRQVAKIAAGLTSDSWEPSGKCPDDYWTWRRGEDRLILCTEQFHQRFRLASQVARRLNLLDRRDRRVLFRAIVFDEYEE
jgi:hypothetical protein